MPSAPTRYKVVGLKDLLLDVIFIIILIATLSMFSIWLMPNLWPLWLLMWISILLFIIVRDTKTTGYRCRKCHHEFEITIFTNIASLHGLSRNKKLGVFGWSSLKCPKCAKRTNAILLKKVK